MAVEIDLSGLRALVTGAGAGIGREIAVWLARAGARVAVLDVRQDKAEETVALIGAEAGGAAFAVVGDARDDGRLIEMIREAADGLGGLDIAVNNIGMMGPLGSAPWLKTTPEMFRDVIEQNLVITGISCMEEAKLMSEMTEAGVAEAEMSGNEGDKASSGASNRASSKASSKASDRASYKPNGRESDKPNDRAPDKVIINISSGETTRPSPYMAGYGAAKSAINHLTQTLAAELGPQGIRVNAIAPGTTLTETVKAAFTDEHYAQVVAATPLRRETHADELARLVVFLASDLARCITGQLILADAGAHLSRTRPANLTPSNG